MAETICNTSFFFLRLEADFFDPSYHARHTQQIHEMKKIAGCMVWPGFFVCFSESLIFKMRRRAS